MRALLLALTLAPATAFAWPIDVVGIVDVTNPISISIPTDLELRRNNTGTAVFVVLGTVQRAALRWSRDPAGGVRIEVTGVATFTGVPNAGCITGANTQPTPAFLLPVVGVPTVGLAWDLCATP